MLDRAVNLSIDILDQRSAAENIKRLHAIADGKNRDVASFGSFENETIRLVLVGDHSSQLRVRLFAVERRVDVSIASGKQNRVDSVDYGLDIFPVGDQRKMNRQSTGGLDCFAVVAAEVKSTRLY